MKDMTTFKENLFAAAKTRGFSDCELYMKGSDSFTVRIHDGEIQEYKNASDNGISFRGTINGKMGYAFSEKISGDVINFLVENAAQNADIIDDPEVEELYPGDKTYPEVSTYSPNLENVTPNDKIEKALFMDKTAHAADPRVKGVDYCVVGTGSANVYIANSLGMEISGKSNSAQGFVSTRVSEDDQVKTGYYFWGGKDWPSFNPDEVAREAVVRATDMLGASSVPSGTYDVIFNDETASDLLQTFWSAFNAEKVQKGFSLLKDKIGEQVAAPCVSLRDDPLLNDKAGSRPFDDEGAACFNKAVIENGVLKTFLHNTKTAKKDGVKPTGNGSKASYKASLGISPGNLYIVPGKQSKDELIKEMGDGLVINSLQGLHSGANATSGDFSLFAAGFLVENGKISRPVEQITVSGNFLDLLKNIVKVADDLNLDWSEVASPFLWVKGISVSGS